MAAIVHLGPITLRRPEFFCCGWWSPWCVWDYIAYEWLWFDLHGKVHWFDRRHSAANERWLRKVQPWLFVDDDA